MRGGAADGNVRLGMPADFAETWLPAALGRFKRAHPAVRIEATVDRNSSLLDRLDRGQFDLALILGIKVRGDAELLATLPMVWIGNGGPYPAQDGPIPLALFEPPCFFRASAITALEEAAIPWRVEFTSPSLAGLWAAVDAGLGITARTAASTPNQFKVLGHGLGLPPLPSVKLSLHVGRAPATATDRLRDILLLTLPPDLSAGREEL